MELLTVREPAQIPRVSAITNASGLAVMNRLRRGTTFTLDRHFAHYGFAVLALAEP